MTLPIIQCSRCKHFYSHIKKRNACKAYPDGIPTEIFSTELDHREPQKGDGGVQFEAVEGKRHPLEEAAKGDIA